MHGNRAIAQQILRKIFKTYIQGLINQHAAEAGAVDEKIAFHDACAVGFHAGNIAIFCLRNFGDIGADMLHPTRHRKISQVICKCLRIHVVGVCQWRAHVPAPCHQRCAPHFTDNGLCRNGFHKRNAAITGQPSAPHMINGLDPITAEGMMIKAIVLVHPVHILDGLLEAGIRHAHEIHFIHADDSKQMTHGWNRGFTDRDSGNVG